MIAPLRWFLGFALVFAAASTTFAQQRGGGRAEAEPQVVGPPADQGTQLFRGLLHHFKIKPVDIRNVTAGENTIIIVLGDPGRYSKLAARHIRNTLAQGGAVLIASDTALDLSPYFPDEEDVQIVGRSVTDPSGENSFRRNVSYPFVVPTALDRTDPSPAEQLFAGFERIATNGPSALRITRRPPYLQRTVGKFPRGAAYPNGNRHDALDRKDVFAAAGVGPENDPFRCLVMADQSVLSNDMLYTSADSDATDNFAFAVRLVPWLQGSQNRTECLFIEDGEVVSRFDEFDFTKVKSQPKLPPLPAPKLPDPMDRKFQEGAAKAIDETVTRFEDSPSLKKELASIGLISTLAVLLLIFAGILLRLRIRSAILARNYQPIPVDPLRLGNDAPLGSFTHRRLELLRGNDFRAPFTEFVNLLFRGRGLPDGDHGARCPKIETDGRNRKYMSDSVRRLWEESRTDEPLSYTKWKELEPILAAVRSAAEADRWRFAPSPATRTDSEGTA